MKIRKENCDKSAKYKMKKISIIKKKYKKNLFFIKIKLKITILLLLQYYYNKKIKKIDSYNYIILT
jgi:hypothetical protein